MTVTDTSGRIVRILHLEDRVQDVQFVQDLLEDQDVQAHITQVARRAPFEEALRQGGFDVVICDFSLPDLDGLSALRLVRAQWPELPVIIVSGSVDSATAVNCLREGATDLLLKDRLERLPSAVLRALDERERRIRLREVEERFQQMADQSPTGFWFIAPGSEEVLYVNSAVEVLWGRPAAMLRAAPRAFLAAVHGDDRERVAAAWDAWIHGTQPMFNEEFRLEHPDGAIRWVHQSGSRITDTLGTVTRFCVLTQEITERKAMELRMQHAQKLEVVGRLAGGIAHDFNTLLTVITATSELALSRLDPEDALITDLAEIRSAGERGATLVAQLMAFSRQQIMRPRVIDIVELLTNLERMMLRLLGAHIRLELVLPPTAVRLRVDPGQLEQVLLNLVVNARDAMRGGGLLSISLAVIDPDEALRPRLGARAVCITITDTGVGMSEEVRQRAFEPFFTTKLGEGGTGLGLSTVYGIIEQSGGTVQLESVVGVGTTFRLLLPIMESGGHADPLETTGASIDRAPSVRSGSGTVLVVDDDQALRYLIKRTLSAAGYTVLMADTGVTALRLLKDLEGGVDLLLTDMVMPEMSGQELAQRVRSLNGELRVLYMSGYTEDEVGREALHDEGTAFLPKPFTVSSLTHAIARALGRA